MYVSIHMLLPFFREHFHQRQPTISTIPATIKDTVLEANTYASILVSQDHSAANMFFFLEELILIVAPKALLYYLRWYGIRTSTIQLQ